MQYEQTAIFVFLNTTIRCKSKKNIVMSQKISGKVLVQCLESNKMKIGVYFDTEVSHYHLIGTFLQRPVSQTAEKEKFKMHTVVHGLSNT